MADAPSVRGGAGGRHFWLVLWSALFISLALGETSCLSRRQNDSPATNECATCHGDSRRHEEPLLQAAPPRDLSGAEGSHYPGVGAHQLHLHASTTHGAVACQECHVVPERVDSPGHAEHAAPAPLHFGALARSGKHEPSYDAVARTCNDSYCHGPARAVWTEPRASAEACGSCHGLPPPAPHPQSEQCSTCHGDVIDAERHFLAPELHVDGKVELRADSCTQCHGHDDEPAPPLDTLGGSSRRSLGVGAHAVHLTGGSSGRALACDECHDVPEKPTDFDHADGLPAEVRLLGVAEAHGRSPSWNHGAARCVDSWCHGPGEAGASSPRWDRPQALGCGGCHGAPPPAPHPQMQQCSLCHTDVAADGVSFTHREHHVDGVIDVELPSSCTSCHGRDNPAPPLDTQGHDETSFRGVGAHQTHVRGTERSRPVPCGDCHQVPDSVNQAGHIDTALPAEVELGGTAVAFGPGARFDGETCVKTSCHGAVFPGNHASGGSSTAPSWTRVDGSQASCGSCHGLPPPRPHPYYASDCGRCHKDMSPDGSTFVRPDLHVDGVVTFELP